MHPTETLSDALDYFTDVAHAGSPAGTVRCYRQKARHLSRLHGETMLDALTRETIERYIATRLKEGAHPHSIHKEMVVCAARSPARRRATDTTARLTSCRRSAPATCRGLRT